jgi:hypothetical protein
VVQGEDVHQVDADLIRRLSAVCIDRGKKLQLTVFTEQSHGNIGITHVNGKQHFVFPSPVIYHSSFIKGVAK